MKRNFLGILVVLLLTASILVDVLPHVQANTPEGMRSDHR